MGLGGSWGSFLFFFYKKRMLDVFVHYDGCDFWAPRGNFARIPLAQTFPAMLERAAGAQKCQARNVPGKDLVGCPGGSAVLPWKFWVRGGLEWKPKRRRRPPGESAQCYELKTRFLNVPAALNVKYLVHL